MQTAKDELKLRQMLCFAVCDMATVYSDDGELQDNSVEPFIDFLRDSVDAIEHKLQTRIENYVKSPEGQKELDGMIASMMPADAKEPDSE